MEVTRVFLNTSMSYSFTGLKQILKDAKMNPETMNGRKFIVFINRQMTAFKLMAGPHYIVYHSNGNRRIPLEAITHFPEFFDGQRINVTGAIKKTIQTRLIEASK